MFICRKYRAGGKKVVIHPQLHYPEITTVGCLGVLPTSLSFLCVAFCFVFVIPVWFRCIIYVGMGYSMCLRHTFALLIDFFFNYRGLFPQ